MKKSPLIRIVIALISTARALALSLLLWTLSLLLWTAAGQAQASLSYTLSSTGLASLSSNGGPNLISDGALRLLNGTPLFSPSNGLNNTGWTPTTSTLTGNVVSQTWPWGKMSCTYSQSGNALVMNISITNSTSSTLTSANICAAMIGYPQQPTVSMADTGPYLMGNNVMVGDPNFRPAVITMDYGTGAIDFCNENISDGVVVQAGGSWNGSAFTLYPFLAAITNLAPGATRNIEVSLRFGASGSGNSLAADLYQRYSATYPFQLQWDDRRLLAQDVLASSPADDQPQNQNPASNPRGWQSWWCGVDFTQPASIAYPKFRTQLLKFAQLSIQELKNRNAQGVIFWDLEGEQYSQPTHTYVGDPALIAALAPEMEYQDSSGKTDDLFLQAFRNAGLKVGVCIRPQQVVFDSSSRPTQTEAVQAGTTIAAVLQNKIAYAQNRWQCSLFYVDTTVDPSGNLYDPTPFQQTAAAYPNILLIPEESSARYSSFSAPFQDFSSHGITRTNPQIYSVYPGAWSSVFAATGNVTNNVADFQAGISNGDTMMLHGWPDGSQNNAQIQSIYTGAGIGPVSARLTSPVNGASASQPVTLSAAATAASGKSISKIDFYASTKAGGTQLLGTASSTPYSFVWNTPLPGPYVLSVTATDSAGLTRTPASISDTIIKAAAGSQINCGGSAVSPFVADEFFTSAGSGAATTSRAVAVAGVANAAPAMVYQTARYGGDVIYTVPNLPAGASYHVRLHFTETYWTAAGQREFNIILNGTQALTNFDIFADAGAANKADVKDFNTTVNSSGQIVLHLHATVDNAQIAGLEITPN
ncbi:MAG: malectin domain-containing carbohydrate-binding protein [Janthinobacterium lividum]